MKIGELAERSGVSPKALRHYERIGVMPAPSRTASGYRDYGPQALQRLDFIIAGRRVGLSLRQLAQILEVRDGGQAPCAEALALVDERLRTSRKASPGSRRCAPIWWRSPNGDVTWTPSTAQRRPFAQ